ncbi:MAG: hypothetical protein WD492_03625 [Alkalispirochaeta sp.]
MSWEDTLREVVRKYYRAGSSDPPSWVATTATQEPVTLSNATCGDRVVVYVRPQPRSTGESGWIWLDVAGCAICKASAEMVVRAADTLDVVGLEKLAREMLSNMAQSSDPDGPVPPPTAAPSITAGTVPGEDVAVILRLREVPGRRRCASLPWEAVLRTLESR